MEDFLLVLLIIGFVWVLIRQSKLSQRLQHLDELYQRLLRAQPQVPLQQAAPMPPPPPRPAVVVPAPPPPPLAPAEVVPVAAQQAAPSSAAPYAYKPATNPAPPVPASVPPPPPIRSPKPHVSLEARLGQNWLNKLGITAMVVGISSYLGYELQHVGPVGKSLAGLVIALAILALGVFFERKPNYRVFARGCIGGGWALLFFLSFAIYHLPLLQVLHSSVADLILMLAVASGMVAHSLRYHSQTVTTLAFLLALLTVGISDVTLFSLLAGALLTAALATIVYRERWFLLGLVGLIGVYVNHAIWLYRVLPGGGIAYLRAHGHAFPEFVPSAALLLGYWLVFRIVYVFRAPLVGNDYQQQQGVASFAAILNSVGLLSLLKYQSSHPEWAFGGLLVLGAVELALSVIARGKASVDDTGERVPRNRPAFIVLSTIASVVLLAAIPFRFHGASWSLLWLLEAEAFFIAGIRLPESVFRRIGIVASFATAVLLLMGGIVVLAIDSGTPYVTLATRPHHPALVLFTAAVVLWLNAELATRLVPSIVEAEFDRFALRTSSYVAAPLAALGLTIALHCSYAWIAVAWLLLSLTLGYIADRLRSQHLATQADLLGIAAIIRIIAVNFQIDPHTPCSLNAMHCSLQVLTVGIAAALLYAATRRKVGSFVVFANFLAPACTWVAGALIATLCWYQLEPISVAVAWGVFGLVLFELGATFRKDYLRQQSYLLLLATFGRIFFANLQVPSGSGGGVSPSLYTVLPLIAAFAWVYERSHTLETSSQSRLDAFAGMLFAWCSVIVTGVLLYFEVRPDWVILAWTLLAIALLALAAVFKRSLFIAQSLVVVAVVAVRGVAFHLFSPTALATTFTTSRWFTVGLTSALLLMALPIAFYLRRYYLSPSSRPTNGSGETPVLRTDAGLEKLLHHPEQPYFFAPLTLLTLLFYVQLHAGLITIGWVALGLVAFLFALAVKERSFRLSGLGLLMLGVAKILFWDVWHAPLAERYLTLIIMGAALLLVSFLYSRYRETLLKFL
jgi:uncharacterized membrane protein